MPVILSVVGPKNSGKTSIIEQLIPVLKSKMYRVATAKHTAHEHLFDREGSDSWRQGQAGAEQVGLFSPGQVVTFDYTAEDTDAAFKSWLASIRERCDVVLVEGLRHSHYPKLLLHGEGEDDYDVHEPVLFRLTPMCNEGQKPKLMLEDLDKVLGYVEKVLKE